MDIFKNILAAALGFALYVAFTHPKYLKKKIPKISFWKLQISPNLRIRLKSGTLRLHHWILLTALLGILNHLAQGVGHLLFIKLFTLGGIAQGLTFRDRFNIFMKKPVKNLNYYHSISVVIPAHNEEKSIRKTLSAIKKQTYKAYEVIVVDNASSDKTAEVARAHGAKVIYETRKGVGFARQAGFLAAKGEIIACTDADSIPPKSWLSTFAYQFAVRKNAAAIAGMYEFYDGSKLLKFLTWLFNYPIFTFFGWYSGANMAVRRDVFTSSGGFDTSLTLEEDSEFLRRLKGQGQVYRLANFKVKTSARRFNNLGLLAGLFDYSYNYIKFKLNFRGNFRAASEVPRLSLASRVAIQTVITTLILAVLFGGLLETKPVKAEVVKRRHQLTYQMKKIETKVSTIPHVYHHHK